jgi:MSHA biogenesis protein MshO
VTGALVRRARGFTLTEAIIVIVITGIISAVVAVFMVKPVQGYFDATRRAQLSDLADTALRRMTRDLRLALPNSVRITSAGGSVYLEFLLTRGGGRYRAELDAGGGGDVLEFGAASAPYRFDVIGQMPAVVAGSDSVAVFNLGPGFGSADAYQGSASNLRSVTAVGASQITVSPNTAFPQQSPAYRFQVVEGPVSYECAPNAGNPPLGTLTRYSGYPVTAAQPTAFAGGGSALLANDVAACAFTYSPNAVAERNGVVGLTLTLTQTTPGGPESVTLFQEAHVSNVP